MFEGTRFSVIKAYQGNGVAELLFRRLEKYVFEEQMCSKLIARTGIDMEVAKRFYEKQGGKMTHIEYENSSHYSHELPKDFIYISQWYEKSSQMYFRSKSEQLS